MAITKRTRIQTIKDGIYADFGVEICSLDAHDIRRGCANRNAVWTPQHYISNNPNAYVQRIERGSVVAIGGTYTAEEWNASRISKALSRRDRPHPQRVDTL